MPRAWGVVSFQAPLKALRAADTARSTSFSVASQTEQMTSSVEGLMVSNFFLSTPSTHSLLIKLQMSEQSSDQLYGYSQADGLLVSTSGRSLEFN